MVSKAFVRMRRWLMTWCRYRTATSLQLVAESTDSSVDYIRSLNPELRRDVTPRGEAYNVRVPGGKGKQFFALLKRIPADRRESARMISIAPGEDLQNVANRTGVSVAQLQAMNSGVDLKSTNKLVVPNSNVRLTLYRRKPGTAEVCRSGVNQDSRPQRRHDRQDCCRAKS